MKKLFSLTKYYSFIIFPLLVVIVFTFICNKYNIVIDTNKLETIVSISASMVGVLITVITIFLAIPSKDPVRFDRLKKSLHYDIYMRNVIAGIVLFFATVLLWFFNAPSLFSVATFLAGIANSVIVTYYTFGLMKQL